MAPAAPRRPVAMRLRDGGRRIGEINFSAGSGDAYVEQIEVGEVRACDANVADADADVNVCRDRRNDGGIAECDIREGNCKVLTWNRWSQESDFCADIREVEDAE